MEETNDYFDYYYSPTTAGEQQGLCHTIDEKPYTEICSHGFCLCEQQKPLWNDKVNDHVLVASKVHRSETVSRVKYNQALIEYRRQMSILLGERWSL